MAQSVKELDGEVLGRTIVQNSILEAYVLKTLLGGKTRRSMSLTLQVSLKALKRNLHHCCLVSDVAIFVPDFVAAEIGFNVDGANRYRIAK